MGLAFAEQMGEGPPLVCVHGAGGNRHTYDALRAAMPKRHVVAVDVPGRPKTGGEPPTEVVQVADAVDAFAKQHLNTPYVVAGHSVGGGCAIELALRADVAGAVLIATGARLRVHPAILRAFDEAAAEGRPQPEAPGLWENDTPDDVMDAYRRAIASTPTAVASSDWVMANRFDRLHDVKNIDVPVLVVNGTEDALTPAKYGEYLAAQIPRATLHIMEGAGHMVLIERAHKLGEVIDAFLAGLPSG